MSVLTIQKPRRMRGNYLGEFTIAADSVSEALDRALGYFHATANKALDIHLNGMPELGVEGNNQPYVVYIDGRPATGRGDIPLATRQVRFTFPMQAITIALSVLKDALITEINRANAPTIYRKGKPINWKAELTSSGIIKMWYGKAGRAPIRVENVDEITDFSVGDWVALVPDMNMLPFFNSVVRDETGKGFMARAASRIKRTLRLRKNVGGIQIGAYRSRAIGRLMNIQPKAHPDQSRPGRKRQVKPMAQSVYLGTAPAIFIRWRVSQFKVS